MGFRRRTLLKSGTAAATGIAAVGSTATAAEPPAVEWTFAAESNYWDGNRTTADIDWIILHTIQGSYEAGIATFENPDSNVSAHYIVGTDPGEFTQMVRNRDMAWTAGNAPYNRRSINIEMEGYAETGFSDQLYENVAELVQFLCEGYDVPKRGPASPIAPCDPTDGPGGIIGHVHVPNPEDCSERGGISHHTDPGPHFDYDRLIDAISD